jgi:hypothetical protein
MISNELLFLLLNAKIAFVSDILLNLLVNSNVKILHEYKIYDSLKTLKPYFQNKSMFLAAFYALLTVIIIVGLIMKTFHITHDKYLPESINEYVIFLVISFLIGYIGDIIIYKINIFPKLKKYYRVVGKGLWGALAILFSVIVALIYLYIYRNYYHLWPTALTTIIEKLTSIKNI